MIVSESALHHWVQLPDRSTLVNDLTMLGLEVDGVEAVAPAFNNVVVGHVVECEQHPNADKLRVTKVDVGNNEILDIVCGAPNCRQGLKVCVAKVGAILPGDFQIKAAQLRGQPSNGMLCSYSELGINIESEGIIELDADAPIGVDVREYLDLDDVTIEIGLTANRADCLSSLGVARDLAVHYQTSTKFETFKKELLAVDRTTLTDDIFPVKIENEAACTAYISRVVRGVNVHAKTPMWMVQFLHRVGVRSIDPIVDVTNYVLHYLGQPLHAFDYAQLDKQIIVRDAKDDEELVLLSGEKVKLHPEILVIADESKPLALAGIFGGEYSGINNNTKDIVIEAASFAPLAIVNRAREFGLHTDASHRFERGVDPEILPVAMELATKLILDICGGHAGAPNYVGSCFNNHNLITLNHSLVERIAGINIEVPTVERILSSVGCKVTVVDNSNESNNPAIYEVSTPSWRFDLAIPEDLVEEVIRFYGYDNIPTQAPVAALNMRQHSEAAVPLQKLKDVLVNRDFQEVVTYSFVDPKLQDYFHAGEENLTLPNPISVEMSQMRLSLFTNLLTTLSYNQKRQNKRVRIFETGLTFIPDAQAESQVLQKPVLAGLISGENYRTNWAVKDQTVDFFTAKGIVEDLLASTQAYYQDTISFKAANVKGFHPGQTAQILVNDKVIGVVGKVHPSLHKPFEISGDVFMFSLDSQELNTTIIPEITPVTKYQTNKRDIALFVDVNVPVGDLLKTVKQAGGELLQDVVLFDLYQGANLSNNQKSIALTLTIASSTHTLEDSEINAEVTQIVTALSEKHGAVLRDA